MERVDLQGRLDQLRHDHDAVCRKLALLGDEWQVASSALAADRDEIEGLISELEEFFAFRSKRK